MFTYRSEVLAALAERGVQPRSTTAPEVVRDFLSDLYRYELRRLRERLVRKAIARPEYAGHVIALRKRYFLLSVPLQLWMR